MEQAVRCHFEAAFCREILLPRGRSLDCASEKQLAPLEMTQIRLLLLILPSTRFEHTRFIWLEDLFDCLLKECGYFES